MRSSHREAIARRDVDAEQQSEQAYALLVDRTIVHAAVVPHGACDCLPTLRLTLDNGVVVDVDGGYGGYTGHSCDEYPMYVGIGELPTPTPRTPEGD